MIGRRTLVIDDYVCILKRRWYLLVLPVVLAAVVGLALTRIVPPEYLSQTLVLIEQQKVPDDYVKPVVSTDLDARLASMKEEILSRSRLLPIIERYSLFSAHGAVMDDRIETMRRKIQIKPIHSEMSHGGGLPGFFISFAAADPHTAQLVCREITTLFVNENLRLREASAEGTTDFLKDQLDAAKTHLDEQDKRMAQFQQRYAGELPADAAANQNLLASLNVQLQAATQALARLEQDRGYEEMLLTQQQQSGVRGADANGSGMAVVPNEAKQVELATLEAQAVELKRHYTAGHPDVVAVDRSIGELRKQLSSPVSGNSLPMKNVGLDGFKRESTVTQQMRAQLRGTEVAIEQKRGEQRQLDSSIRSYQSRVLAAPSVEEEYKVMTRGYETAEVEYKSLLGKMNQSRMASDLEKRQQGEQFSVLDPANLPDAPSYPRRGTFVGGGLIAGLLLGLPVVVSLEYRVAVLRSERDIGVLTTAPVLTRLSYIDSVAKPVAAARAGLRLEGGGWRKRKDA